MDSLNFLKLGNKAFLEGNYPQALTHYQKALERGKGDPLWIADLYGNIANVYAVTGQFNVAVPFYEKSVQILRQEEAFSRLGMTFVNIGNAYADHGDGLKAIHFYKQGALLLEEEGEYDSLSTLYGNLSLLCLKQSDNPSALDYAEKAMAYAKRLNQPVRIAEASHRLAKVKDAQGDLRAARNLSQASFEIFNRLKDEMGMASTLFHQADLYERERDIPNAISCLRRVVAIDEKYQLPKLSENRSRLSRLEKIQKANEKA